ncbi:MAG: CotH kinase family protein [Pirellula sp.]|nr:CotH kinase family protein [Pirellula sp.]
MACSAACLNVCLIVCFLHQPGFAQSTSTAPREAAESRPEVDKGAGVTRGDFLFGDRVHSIQIEISESTMREVEADHRPYGRTKLTLNGETFPSTGLKLKGAAGSYRHFDEKPAFTINLDKFRKKQSYDGIDKFHLNNAAQDETFLHEWLGSEMFKAILYPSPRVGHAWVTLNDGEKRLYVVRENYNPKMLSRFFADSKGNLYDGGFLQDIDAELEKDAGEGDDDRLDLAELRDALSSEDFSERLARVPSLVDMDRFMTFMAVERLLCHWDGYSCNTNNYRLYFDPESGKAVFLPHGMDQLFGGLDMDMFEYGSPLLSSFVMGSNQWRQRYRQVTRQVYDTLSKIDWDQLIDERVRILRMEIESFPQDETNGFNDRIDDLKGRVKERFRILEEQLAAEEPNPTNIALKEPMPLRDWYENKEREEIEIRIPESNRNEKIRINIPREGEGYGGIERSELVTNGTYKFSGRFRLSSVQAFEDAEETMVWKLSNNEEWVRMENTDGWQDFSIETKIVEDQKRVVMGIAIRAKRGLLVVDPDSLQLTKTAE